MKNQKSSPQPFQLKPLVLNVKAEYYDQIESGAKLDEYRETKDYWAKRLLNKTFSEIIIKKGYPKAGDTTRELKRPWKGFRITKIQHKHFGPNTVRVFAIKVN